MYTKSLLALGLAATLTSAAPSQLLRRQDAAAASTSKAFHLVAKVADPACELDPPVTGWVLSTAHTGAGLNIAVLSNPAGSPTTAGRIWYLNGTAPAKTDVLTDGGTPPYPYGISVQGPDESYSPTYPDEHGVNVNVGGGTPTTIEDGKGLVNQREGAAGGSFLACKRLVDYYGTEFTVLEYAYGSDVPDGCAAISLEPQCAELNDLPPDAGASHEFAQTVQCSA